jgi:hypothetical protein
MRPTTILDVMHARACGVPSEQAALLRDHDSDDDSGIVQSSADGSGWRRPVYKHLGSYGAHE